nr:hypothetical protein Itr_chr15CG07490 [Ipomoea trifida]
MWTRFPFRQRSRIWCSVALKPENPPKITVNSTLERHDPLVDNSDKASFHVANRLLFSLSLVSFPQIHTYFASSPIKRLSSRLL